MSEGTARQSQATDEEYVGQSIPRVDAPAKVTGRAVYTMDLDPGNLLHAKLVTSPYAHARITDVDTEEASELDGVHAVVTGRDAPDTLRGAFIYDQPVLTATKVRHVGEPVAIVAAETEAIAERAVSLVDVSYERLDAVFDLEAAFERDPPAVVHENVREYEFATRGDPRYGDRGHVDDHDADRPNLLYKDSHETGDVDAGFDEADHVVEHTYEVDPIQHCSMEPRVAIARVDGDTLSLETSHQVPHNVEKKLCRLFPSLERSRVRVRAPYVGGGFGGKITAYFEALLVTVARAVSRPVRLQFDRAEEFTTGVSRPRAITRVKDGVTAAGDLVAREVDVKFDCGAYNEQVFRCTVGASDQVYGAYDVPNVRWDSHAVYTNHPMYAAFRGFGKPEVNWAIERHMDRVAAKLGIDPVAYRKRNRLQEGETNAVGETLGPNDTGGCLDTVDALRDVDPAVSYPEYDADEWCFGVGVGYAVKSIAQAAASVTIKVRSGMHVEVHVGASDIGQGSDTVFTQLAAEAFGVDVDHVTLVTGDTARTPYTRGPTGSRFTYHAGHAIRQAAADAKARLAELAAERLDADPDAMVVDGVEVVDGESGRSLHVDELYSDYDQEGGVSNTVLAAGGECIASATYDARGGPGKKACFTPIAQAALVAVNRTTGQVDPLRAVSACDVGRALNPKAVEQQVEGGTAQGIASALYESIAYDDGRVTNPNFKDYAVPGATELPYENEVVVIESYEESGPYGAKGVGEAGVMASAPAVGNAVADALDLDDAAALDALPLAPHRVLDLVVAKE
jgi:CO/xanthine dehydrogenase Mo-binding subunit